MCYLILFEQIQEKTPAFASERNWTRIWRGKKKMPPPGKCVPLLCYYRGKTAVQQQRQNERAACLSKSMSTFRDTLISLHGIRNMAKLNELSTLKLAMQSRTAGNLLAATSHLLCACFCQLAFLPGFSLVLPCR